MSMKLYCFICIVSARPSKSPDPSVVASPERIARTRTRMSGVSQSQRKFCNFLWKKRVTYNGKSLMKTFFLQLAVDRVPRHLD